MFNYTALCCSIMVMVLLIVNCYSDPCSLAVSGVGGGSTGGGGGGGCPATILAAVSKETRAQHLTLSVWCVVCVCVCGVWCPLDGCDALIGQQDNCTVTVSEYNSEGRESRSCLGLKTKGTETLTLILNSGTCLVSDENFWDSLVSLF